jgi:hypothetical protein
VDEFLRVPAGEPIPLSVLALDLELPTVGDWRSYLRERGIDVVIDDVGRPSISRADARRLFREREAAQQKAREMAERNEAAAIAADQEWRASLHGGIPWHRMPDPGLLPVVQMAAAIKDAQPRRTSVLHDALQGSEMTVHSIREPLEDE